MDSPSRKKILIILIYLFLGLLSIIFFFPFYHMVNISLMPSTMLYEINILPKVITFRNYILLFKNTLITRWIINTFIYAGSVVLLTIILDMMVAYSLSKAKFPGRDAIFLIILASMMVPSQVTLISLFVMFHYMNLINTFWGLILPGIASPFGVFLLRQYMLAIPSELLDAARVDGCSEWCILWKIVFPLSRPAIATVASLKFIGHWNSFFWPLVIMTTQDNYTLPVGLATLSWWGGSDWGLLMAGSTISILPTLIVFAIFQKYIISGLTLRRVRLKK